MTPRHPVILLTILCFISTIAHAQPPQPEMAMLSTIPLPEHSRFVHELQLETLDSAAFLENYKVIYALATERNEWRLKWDLDYYYFLQRGKLKTTSDENLKLLIALGEAASKQDFRIGNITAKHYLFFEKYYAEQILLGALYTHILQEIEQMREVGFEKFSDYGLDWMLYHDAKFMYELEDFEKALQIFQLAEQYIQPTERNKQPYVLVLNHLQSIYQKQNDLETAIGYAKKILQFVEAPPTDEPERLNFYLQWEGLTSLDMAAMLVRNGDLTESEAFAQKGYELAKAHDETNRIDLRLEYDALKVLVSTKLELGDLGEAAHLLQRLDELYGAIGKDYENYFNNIEYFEICARYHEMKGHYAEAIHFSNLAKPLRDSLARRNDARKLEQLGQRLEAQKFTQKIQLVEQEREFQKWLRNAACIILALVIISAYLYFQRLHQQKKQRIASLETAKNELSTLTQRFREKSAMAENLRHELDKLAQSGKRSEYLEQLTNSTILTEGDWLNFRQVFEKAHPHFLEDQKSNYPDITPAELRYLALEKLGLSTGEMANMLGVSASAVRKTKARAMKKWKVDQS